MKQNLCMIMIIWTGFAVLCSEGDQGGMAPQVSPRCSPVLLLNCIGSQKDHPSDKCCTSLRSIAKEKCFCSRLRAGVVDANTYIPIARACNIPLDLGNGCQRSDGRI